MQLSKPTIDMADGRIPFCDSPPNSSYPYCATFEQSNGIGQGNYYCPTEQPLYSAFRESAFGELMKALNSQQWIPTASLEATLDTTRLGR